MHKSAVARLIIRNLDTAMGKLEDASTTMTAKLPMTEADATTQAAIRSQLVPIISSHGLHNRYPIEMA